MPRPRSLSFDKLRTNGLGANIDGQDGEDLPLIVILALTLTLSLRERGFCVCPFLTLSLRGEG